jgi:hypothetical protein
VRERERHGDGYDGGERRDEARLKVETGRQIGGGVCLECVKILVILFLVFIVGSLLSALYFLVTDRGRSERMARALTIRVVLSVVLFALLMIGYYFGFITGKL